MNLPDKIATKDLNSTHPEFDLDHLELCRALYHGGRVFRDQLNNFLIKRKIEDKDHSHYELRKRRSFYVPYAAGLLDWICAAAFTDGVRLRVVSGSDEAREYYESLNENADGLGTPLTTLSRMGLLSALKYGRAYFFPDFVSAYSQPTKPETKDARITMLDPIQVNDWQMNEDGCLEWVRCQCSEKIRNEAEPWKTATDSRDVWTFFDDENITVYEHTTVAGQRKNSFASLLERRPHGLGRCPVFDVRAPENIWVLDRVFEVAVALFNREASLTWALDMSAYATLVLKLMNTKINQIVSTELAALRIEPGEDAGYIAPPGGIYEPLFKDADRLKGNMYEVVRALGLNVAAIPQAGRLSGDAVGKIREPMDVLLDSFSQPILEALARLLDALREKRGDDDVEIELVLGSETESVEGDEDGEDDEADASDESAGGEAGGDASGTAQADGNTGSEGSARSFRDELATEDRGG